MILDEAYWTHCYKEKTTGWDIGSPSTPLKQYLDQISNKDLKILIPGAGNAYEAEYAFSLGFENVHVLDFSPVPIAQFKQSCPDFPVSNIFIENFFFHEGKYDLILEQTFFSAIDPKLRKDYIKKMYELLLPSGKLTGVMFSREFNHPGPPFGGNKEEYIHYFTPEFEILKLEPCYNSIAPRMGNELFIQLRKN